MKKLLLFISLFAISACSIQKSNIRESFFYNAGDCGDLVFFSVNSKSVIVDYRQKSVAVMDKFKDTIPMFRIELPKLFNKCVQQNEDLFFFYDKGKAIFIHRDSHDKSMSPLTVRERCDSLDYLSPWCSDEQKKMMKIIPNNGKYDYKCLTRNKTCIYIYNFKGKEMDDVVEMIRSSFEYLPYDQ